MDQFWSTLAGAAVGGGLAVIGQWETQRRAAKTEKRAQWLRFQREAVQGVQESLAELWRCVAETDPEESQRQHKKHRHGRVPPDEAAAIVKSSLYRSRLPDPTLAEEIRQWMSDTSAALDAGPVKEPRRAQLLTRYRALTTRLGKTLRELHASGA